VGQQFENTALNETDGVAYACRGSEKGFSEGSASFIASTLRIRGTNVLYISGSIKIGEMKDTRKRDESSLEFTWFVLCSGVGDVVGF
jgi:hypothetical protein